MSDVQFTREELEEEIQRRKDAGISVSSPSIVDKYFGGFTSKVKAFGAGAAGSINNPISAVQGMVSDSQPFNERTGTAESQYSGNETAYRFGEGFAPAAAVGTAVGTPVAGLVTGVVGGLANVGAKAVFPESVLGQTAINLLPGLAGSFGRSFRSTAPKVPTASTDPDTGVLLSPGQRSGNKGTLLQEERLRRDVRTGGTVETFDKSQQAAIDGFIQNIQQIKKTLLPEQVRNLIGSRYDAFNKSIISSFKKQNDSAFEAATSIKGDVIPTNNVNKAVDELIAQYSNVEVPGNAAVLTHLKRIRENMSSMTGNMILGPDGMPRVGTQGNLISVERLKQNLSAWSDTAYSGTYSMGGVQAFDDVAPGVAKGVARKVLNSFRADLDDAVKSGIPGANLLKSARDNYAAGLKHIETVANSPVNKYVTSSRFEKAPEKILDDLVKMKPTERAELAVVLGKDYPQLYDTVRSQALTTILSKYRSGNGLDIKRLFEDQPFSGNNAWMFANKAEQKQVNSLTSVLEQINRQVKNADMTPAELQAASRAAYESAGVVGGSFAKYGTQAVLDVMRVAALRGSNDPKKLSYMFFTPNGQQLIQELAKPRPNPKYLSRQNLDALLYGPTAASGVSRNTAKENEPVSLETSDYEKEMQRRGLK
jgi:hypothetical protein